MRGLLAFFVVVATLAVAPAASAEILESQDHDGRTLTFDVRSENVDVEWYAELMRNAAHGDEVERVTFVIVSGVELRRICGSGAAGCYGRGGDARIVVPAGSSAGIAHTLVHEYGHHLDAWRGVAGAESEPNGSASWWEARGVAQLLAAGKVAHDYSLGWDRSIGELFAEDYAQLHLETEFKIRWLALPGEAVRAALRKDLENVPAAPTPAAPRAPLVLTRSGTLITSTPTTIPFDLLGPGRHATFSASVKGTAARVRMELRCSDGQQASRVIGGARRSATIDLHGLGPARCSVSVRRSGTAPAAFYARLRLAVEPPGTGM